MNARDKLLHLVDEGLLNAARQKLDIEKRMKIQDIEEEFKRNLEQINAEYKKLRDELI